MLSNDGNAAQLSDLVGKEKDERTAQARGRGVEQAEFGGYDPGISGGRNAI